MKKSLFLATTALLTFACTVEIENPVQVPEDDQLGMEKVTIYASLNEETKTTVANATGIFSWQTGEKIGVANEDMSGADPLEFTLSDAAEGAFTGSKPGDKELVFAVSPLSAVSNITEIGGLIEYDITLPTSYSDYVAGTTNAIMIGTPNGGSYKFKFYNAAAVLKFTYVNAPVGTKKCVLTTPEKIAGTWSGLDDVDGISLDQSTIASSGSSTVTITLKDAVAIANQTLEFCFPVPVGNYTGFAVELQDATGTRISGTNKSKDSISMDLVAGNVVLMPTINLPAITRGSEYTLTPVTKSSNGFSDWDTAWEKNSVSWTPSKISVNGSPNVGSVDANRGQQFGAKNTNQVSSMTITGNGSGYKAFCSSSTAYGITGLSVSACAADGNTVTLGASVGGVSLTPDTASHTISGTGANAVVTTNFTSSEMLVGDIVITLSVSTAGAVYLKTLTVNPKDDPEIVWKKAGSAATEDTATMRTGDDDLPTAVLDNPNSVTVSYESSDTDVATIDPSTGSISLVGEGDTVISATSTETEDYSSVTVSYTLSVTDSRSKLDAPTFSKAAGEWPIGTETTISATHGATIYYTIDGSEPSMSSSVYSSAIAIDDNFTLKAIAVKADYKNSDVAEAEYTVPTVATPVISISSNTVTITCETVGATIYYTTDETDPTESSSQYSSSFVVAENVTVKAFATLANYKDSAIASKKNGHLTLSIDFESTLDTYSAWDFSNLTSQATNTTGYGGSGKHATCQTASGAYAQTHSKISSPISMTCYYTKCSSNTNSSSKFIIQVSSDGSSWTDVVTGKTMNSVTQNTWYELTADLSSYSNVYVRVYYSGTNAVRGLDDILLIYD